MGSTKRNASLHMSKTIKTGSRAAVSPHRGSEPTGAPSHRGQSPGAFNPMPSRRSEPFATGIYSTVDYPRSLSPQPGPGISGASLSRGNESKSKPDSSRPTSHQRTQQTQAAPPMYRHVSPPREEGVRKGSEKSGHDRTRLVSDTRSSRRLSFLDEKDNIEVLPEDPPSKVQYPQGVRVPRRHLIHPKDEAVQTDPIRKNQSAAEARSPRKVHASPPRGTSIAMPDSKTSHRRMQGHEAEVGQSGSTNVDLKPLRRSTNLESSLKLSVLRDPEGRHQVPQRPDPESMRKQFTSVKTKGPSKVTISSEVRSNVKPSVRGDNEPSRRVTISPKEQSTLRARPVSESPPRLPMSAPMEPTCKQSTARPQESVYEHSQPTRKESAQAVDLELTPRPLPPRSLPKYEPNSYWWHLLNPEEVPQSRSITPDFESSACPSPDLLSYFYEMDSWPCGDDHLFQREKWSPSPPPATKSPSSLPKESPCWAPLKEMPQASKITPKQSIQRFSAFFLGM